MSFILDALKKSETDRQQRSTAEFANVPTSGRRREGPPAWLWVVAVLLLVNLAVLTGILLRPDSPPVEPAARPAEEPQATAAARPAENREEDFATQVAAARENAPPPRQPVEIAETPPRTASPPPRVTVASQALDTARLPTIQQLQAGGTLTLPELHVDIHVYSEVAGDRFVFINMVKHNEGSRLAEGPLVEEITPDGVILTHDGTTFLLPRD